LFDWLNGYEYHRDAAKREKIASLHRLMPLEHSMPILVGMLGDKVQAITQLAGLIAIILGREQSIQVVHYARPPAASER
jgi:transcription antitermination factor NusA-like protein